MKDLALNDLEIAQ